MGRASTARLFSCQITSLSAIGETTRIAVQAAWQKAAERIKKASECNTNEKKHTN
jgi:hypothetical protein